MYAPTHFRGEVLSQHNSDERGCPGYKTLCLAIAVTISASALNVATANGQTCVTPPPNMVAWWPLDELAGPTAAEIVNGNTGTHINGPVPLAGAFVLNSLCFNGLTQYVEVPDAPTLNFGAGDLSVDAWVRTTTTGGVKVIVEKRENAPTGVVGYSMYLYQGNLGFQIADGNGTNTCSCLPTRACTNYNSGAFVADGAWHHVAVTVNRTSNIGGTFYMDGAFVSNFNPTCQPGSITNNGVLRIGSLTLGASGASLFNGCIDEVELFNRELSQPEITAIFAAGAAGKCKTSDPVTKVSKWTQLPHPNGEGFDAASNLWWNKAPGTGGQRVLADDFRSRCLPGATCCETCFVTWKGSYVDPNFPVGILPIDGFLISFFTDQPATAVDPSQPKDLIVTYFVDLFDEFPSTACPLGCDGHSVFDYSADLRSACIINNPTGIAQNQCLPMPPDGTIWWISIEPVLGFIYTKDPVNFCQQVKTNSSWPNDFWGWHTTPPQFNFNDDAFIGTLSISPAPKIFTYNWLTDLHWIDVAPAACLPPDPILSVNLAFDLHDNLGVPACWDQPACILPPTDPSSDGVDVPTGYQWSGGDVVVPPVNVVVADDFISDGRPITCVRWWGSYFDPAYIPEACCFVDGSCLNLPPGQCGKLGGVPQGPGTLCLGDTNFNGVDDACEQPLCGPDPIAPIRCLPMTCPVAGEDCLPTCVLVDTVSGVLISVLDCKCMSPNDCHVDIPTGANPVPTCTGFCPSPGSCINTLTDNLDGTSTLCCQCVTITQCGPDQTTSNQTCTPVICPVPGQECLPTCVLVDANGLLIEVLHCKCMSPEECHVDITPGVPPSCIGTCPNQGMCETMLTPNPDGTFTLCCECNPPPECGPDATQLACLPFVCPIQGEECLPVCATWDPLTGVTKVIECQCMNPDDCHLVIVQGTVPQCAGTCPNPVDVCTTTQVQNPDGTITFCCQCVPIPQCGPDPFNPLACAQTACPVAGEVCLPTCVLVETGTGILLSVLNCQCMSPNACHIEIDDTGVAGCVGSCPAQGQCVTSSVDNGNGTTTLCCQCLPAIVCGPDATGGACLPVVCPIAGDKCLPICVIFDPFTGTTRITNCQCMSPTACHLEILAGAQPQCIGVCPNPFDTCTTTQTTNADGTITFCCSCGLPAASAATSDNSLDSLAAHQHTHSPIQPLPQVKSVAFVESTRGARQGVQQIDGWFISFHHGDPAGVFTCPPDFLSGVSPTVLGLYYCPADAIQITDTGTVDCFQHRVFQYDVDLSRCCLICTQPDPRLPGALPAQQNAFFEIQNFDYWLDIQAVVGATFIPDASGVCQKQITSSLPSSLGGTGNFWGWHTSPAQTQLQGPLNEACVGTVLTLPPAAPFCPEYGAWLKLPWQCPTPPPHVDMAFELLTPFCACHGDMDGNGVLNGLDIQKFVDCLIGTAGPGVNCFCADMNSDLNLNLIDVQLFISALLSKAPCP